MPRPAGQGDLLRGRQRSRCTAPASRRGFTQISIIAEGSIKITGNGKFKPENDSNIQFVTNGDFELGGTADADDPVDMDGQIMVREQMKIYGNSEFQGRVMVEDRDSATNVCDAATNPERHRRVRDPCDRQQHHRQHDGDL